MGKRNLFIGLISGAIIGGVVSLFNRDTRDYVKTKCDDLKAGSSYYLKNPSEAIYNARQTVNTLNQALSNGADNTLNVLEQVGDTIDKFTKTDGPKSIE